MKERIKKVVYYRKSEKVKGNSISHNIISPLKNIEERFKQN